jgi:hypothetical protein
LSFQQRQGCGFGSYSDCSKRRARGLTRFVRGMAEK